MHREVGRRLNYVGKPREMENKNNREKREPRNEMK